MPTQNERPIIFSTPMIKAILENRKTQTRRVIKPQPSAETMKCFEKFGDFNKTCPYGLPGDRLWVRETWGYSVNESILYKADFNENHPFIPKWTPSIFMPRKYSRITLEITNIRVERVQEMSCDDAIKEGMALDDSVYDFSKLWDSINGKGAWERNDWVWVIEFKPI